MQLSSSWGVPINEEPRRALIVVDLQSDFILPGAPLSVPSGFQIANLCEDFIIQHRKDYECVVLTQDWHPKDHKSFVTQHPNNKVFDVVDLNGLQQVLWPEHCVTGSSGSDLFVSDELADVIIRKGQDPELDSYSAFYDNDWRRRTGLRGLLTDRGVTHHVDVIGIALDYCVKFTAIDARKLGFQVRVFEDLCAPVTAQGGLDAIKELKSRGIEVRNYEQNGVR